MEDDAQLQDWLNRLEANLQTSALPIDIDGILDMAREIAHTVARPAVPLTAYLVGVAAGRAMAEGTDVRLATAAAIEAALGTV